MNKNMRRLFDIGFTALYLSCVIAYWLVGGFAERDTLRALGLLFTNWAAGLGSLIMDMDFKENKIRPTTRTIGLFVLGIVYFSLLVK